MSRKDIIPSTFLAKRVGQPAAVRRRSVVQARYDAATLSDDSRRHWEAADWLSADAENSAAVRLRLRNRARYEIASNSYARGLSLTLSNWTIGTGPRLNITTQDRDTDRRIEIAWRDWCRASRFCQKLQTMRKARFADGEAFAVLTTNPRLRSQIQLDLNLREADECSTPDIDPNDRRAIDGIRFDQHGNAVEYHFLKSHPAGPWAHGLFQEYDRIPAEAVLHWYRLDRPGQHRGIPEITPAIPLFSQLRRYTLAVLASAETAADFAMVAETENPPGDEGDSPEAMDLLELEKRMLTFLPAGYKLKQTEAEQPTTTYAEFKRNLLNEALACVTVPYNVGACDSSSYNYASGRLDHQSMAKFLEVDRESAAEVILDPVLWAWFQEAILVSDLIPARMRNQIMREGTLPHEWLWTGEEHVDPLKEAAAAETRLTTRQSTYSQEFARVGSDWQEMFHQMAREQALAKELGIELPTSQSAKKLQVTQASRSDDEDAK